MKPMFALSVLVIGAALLQVASYAGAQEPQTDPSATPQATTQATAQAPTATDQTSNPSTAVTAKIKAEMAAQQLPSLSLINVDTDSSGVVSLTGYALSQQDIDKTVQIAQGTSGVSSVNNSLSVKSSQ